MRLKPFAILAVVAFAATSPPAHADYNAGGIDHYIAARDWTGALAYAQAWTKAQPDDVVGWYNLGQVYLLGLKRPADAIAPFQRAVQLRPEVADFQYHLGSASLRSGQAAAAVMPLQRATELAPKNMLYWYQLAAAYSVQRQYDAETKVLQAAEGAAGPTTNYAGWFDLGIEYEYLHDYQRAIHAYRQSVRLKPDFGDGWNNLGATERDYGALGAGIGVLKQAEADLQRAVALGNSKAAANLADTRNIIAGAKAQQQIKARMAPYEQHIANCHNTGHDYTSGFVGPCP